MELKLAGTGRVRSWSSRVRGGYGAGVCGYGAGTELTLALRGGYGSDFPAPCHSLISADPTSQNKTQMQLSLLLGLFAASLDCANHSS